jgi:hypothetical protein
MPQLKHLHQRASQSPPNHVALAPGTAAARHVTRAPDSGHDLPSSRRGRSSSGRGIAQASAEHPRLERAPASVMTRRATAAGPALLNGAAMHSLRNVATTNIRARTVGIGGAGCDATRPSVLIPRIRERPLLALDHLTAGGKRDRSRAAERRAVDSLNRFVAPLPNRSAPRETPRRCAEITPIAMWNVATQSAQSPIDGIVERSS